MVKKTLTVQMVKVVRMISWNFLSKDNCFFLILAGIGVMWGRIMVESIFLIMGDDTSSCFELIIVIIFEFNV